jgi:hypothetical protein
MLVAVPEKDVIARNLALFAFRLGLGLRHHSGGFLFLSDDGFFGVHDTPG